MIGSHARHVASLVALGVFAALALGSGSDTKKSEESAASATSAAAAGCTKDTECKGDRVCDHGRCVSTGAKAAATAAPTVAPAPSIDIAMPVPKQLSISANARSTRTVAGALSVVEVRPQAAYELRLGTRVLVRSDMEAEGDTHAAGPKPSFAAMFENTSGHDQVVVVRWDGMGNACNGYGYSFVGLSKAGASVVKDIPFCGGPDPVIKLHDAGGVLLEIPGRAPNRGAGYVKAERWLFADGKARQI